VEINMLYDFFFGILFLINLISAILFVWHFLFSLRGIKKEKNFVANLLAPIILFLPNLYTEKGNYHRIKVLQYISVFVICFFLLFALQTYKNN